MSGVYHVVDCLQEHSGIRAVSHESLTRTIDRHGELAGRIVEQLDGAISAYDEFSRLRWPYQVLLRQALLEEVSKDNMVYHGYSAHFLLPALQHFIRVRIDAPLDLRIKMTMERMQCDEDKARAYIADADNHRVQWARLMYWRDLRDPRYYDLHLNLGHMSLNAVCSILDRVYSEQEFQILPETGEEVERLLLAARIEAALVSDTRTNAYEIRARVEGENIRLLGPYIDKSNVAIVREIAEEVAGVKEVSYEPGYVPSLDMLHAMM